MKLHDVDQNEVGSPALSKRAARRLIQRAFVLVGRDKSIRQQLREASLITLWRLEDWGLEWTVTVEGGKFEFHRGKSGKPQVTYTWPSAEEFLTQIETGASKADVFQWEGSSETKRLFDPAFAAFCRSLSGVLRNPIDDDGERLL